MGVSIDVMREMEGIVGRQRLLTAAEDLLCYGYDATGVTVLPELVAEVQSTAQVAAVLALCQRRGLALVTRGSGSGLAAGAVPVEGGVLLSLARMNRILQLDLENMAVEVESGVVTHDLQCAVERQGLFYPPDPSSLRHCTIGGNIACNAGGARCLKYGVTANYVLGLTVVLADGQVLRCGGRTLKNVTGYNLAQLFTGSEGTLGVITEARLRLLPLPSQFRTAVAAFSGLEACSRTVQAILKAGVIPAALELMDATAIQCVEEAYGFGLPSDAAAMLLIEVDGRDTGTVERDMADIETICRQSGAISLQAARSQAERERLWQARRSVSPALARRAPHKLGEDICVPRSRIPEAIARIQEISRRHGLPIAVFGHAGDGNLHPNILYDRRDARQRATVERMAAAIFATALELGGTLTGEHGIGQLKRPYLESDLGTLSIAVQQRIRQALDPAGILNPGKLLPPQQASAGAVPTTPAPGSGRHLLERALGVWERLSSRRSARRR
jgi:glycolate oxidase